MLRSHFSGVASHVTLLGLLAVALGLLSRGESERAAPPRTALSLAVEEFDPQYLDRARITEQSVSPTGLVSEILSPSLGFPRRVAAGARFSVFLAHRPDPGATFWLLPRSALGEIDEVLYGLPPREDAPSLLSRKLESGKGLAAGPVPLSSSPGDLVEGQCDSIAREDAASARGKVTRIRHLVGAAVEKAGLPARSGNARGFAGSDVTLVEVEAPRDLASGLYALVLLDERRRLVDSQLNAVYRGTEGDTFRFVVAADLQWGDSCAVAASVLRFVAFLNGLALHGDPATSPEFAIVAGDVVDASFASAGSFMRQVFVGADYPRDYLQAWLALAKLRIPVYLVPGNHDGYRFEGALGSTASDGLLLFEGTFGPLYHSFDRPPFRFVFLNSYDLPPQYRSVRRSAASSFLERLAPKFNVLNWGGGMRRAQHQWLAGRLGLAGPEKPGHPVVVLHHDPRGSYPAVRPIAAAPENAWTTTRHFPITAAAGDRRSVFAPSAPGFAETVETHVGYYTPLRDPRSAIRVGDWFDLGIAPAMPETKGFPGWIRFQQGWHSNFVYTGGLEDAARFETEPELAPPDEILGTLAAGRVREIFKGHDNRFGRAALRRGESIFGPAAATDLARWGGERARALVGGTRLAEDLTVYHAADVADLTSEGHGYLWVEASGDSLRVTEIAHDE